MADKPKSTILKFVEYFPAFTALVVVIGFFKLTAYYSVFGLSIYKYIEVSDFISQGISDLSYFFIYLLLIVPILSIPINYVAFKCKPIDVNDDTHKQPKAKKLLSGITRLINFLNIFMIVAVVTMKFTFNYPLRYTILVILSCLAASVFFYFSLFIAEYYLENAINFNYYKFISSIIITGYITFVTLISVTTALNIRDLDTNKDSIEIKEKTIHSNKTYYYIGETKSYLFFYNAANDSNDIYKKSEISKITTVN